jgi:capsular polysaccharide transport system permease protein
MLNLRAPWGRPAPARRFPALVHPAPATAPPIERERRRWHLWSFAICVVAPLTLAAIYWLGIASDQYVSEFRFMLRAAEDPQPAPDWLSTANAAQSQAAVESRMLIEYATSRAIVDDVSKALDLRRVYASPAADWWSRLSDPVPVEALVEYWRARVDAFYDPGDATIIVSVRAFSPHDALAVAEAVVAACEKVVNNVSLQMRHDALRQSEAEVATTETRLAAVLAEIRDFRDRRGLIDPAKTADASAQTAARLQEDLVRANTRLATLRAYMRDSSPTITVLKAQIRSLEAQRRALAANVANPNPAQGDASSGAVGAFEALENRRRFAEDAYHHALDGLDRARADANRQQVYIASFVPPSLAEAPLYPRRWRAIGIVALVSFGAWAIGSLTLQSIRDHL